MTSIHPLLMQVKKLVDAALPQILEMRYDVKWKSDGSPVTAADFFLEQQIRSLLERELSNLCFIGEESWDPSAPSPGSWVAVLDPIDGTENFCSGLKEWGTSLSLWRNGTHCASMLMLPELGEAMWSGKITMIPRSRIVGFSSSYHNDIGQGISNNAESRIMGCSVYNFYNVIRGSFARFCNPKGAFSWDLLGGVMLAQEAGCEVQVDGLKYDGHFLEPGRRYRVDIHHRYDFHPR